MFLISRNLTPVVLDAVLTPSLTSVALQALW
jgi:hypothetical protein